MGKMNEIDLILDEIQEHTDALSSLIHELTSILSSKPTVEETQKEEKKKLTLEEVRALLAAKSRDGFTNDVKALLSRFGANKLSEVKETDYEELYLQAEEIGNA